MGFLVAFSTIAVRIIHDWLTIPKLAPVRVEVRSDVRRRVR